MLELNKDFWDCECKQDYIHPKSEQECETCGAVSNEQPDSREFEVITYEFKKNPKTGVLGRVQVCNVPGYEKSHAWIICSPYDDDINRLYEGGWDFFLADDQDGTELIAFGTLGEIQKHIANN